jgi:hypothetical protein
MSFDWLHYLDLAAELSEQAGSSKHKDANLRPVKLLGAQVNHFKQPLLLPVWKT